MAQTFLERLSLRLGKDLGDTPISYTADGKTLTAEQRESAINRALAEIYDMKLGAGVELTLERAKNFMNEFNEYRHLETLERMIPTALKMWTKPDKDILDIRKIISIQVDAVAPLIENVTAYPYSADQFHSVVNNEYSNYYPTVTRPWFFEFKDNFSLEMGKTGASDNTVLIGTLKLLCLIAPVYQSFISGGTDILAPRGWEDLIIEMSKSIIQGSHQV